MSKDISFHVDSIWQLVFCVTKSHDWCNRGVSSSVYHASSTSGVPCGPDREPDETQVLIRCRSPERAWNMTTNIRYKSRVMKSGKEEPAVAVITVFECFWPNEMMIFLFSSFARASDLLLLLLLVVLMLRSHVEDGEVRNPRHASHRIISLLFLLFHTTIHKPRRVLRL